MAKLFSIVLFMCAVLAVLGLLSGCGGTGQGSVSSSLGSASMQTTGKNRNDAWSAVEIKKGDVVKDIETTKQKELDLEIAKASQVKVVLDSPEKISAWNNAQATRDLGEVAKNLSKGQTPSPYAEYFRPTPLPKSAVAEVIDSTGNALVGAANSPAGVLGSTAYAFGRFASGAKGGNNVTATEGSTVTVNQAKATGKSTATAGNGGGTAKEQTADTTVNPSHWLECNTTVGRIPTLDEVNKCMQDYGYDTTVQDGQIYLDGKPFTGAGVK